MLEVGWWRPSMLKQDHRHIKLRNNATELAVPAADDCNERLFVKMPFNFEHERAVKRLISIRVGYTAFRHPRNYHPSRIQISD
jgi:hypothetical protein